MNMTKKYGVGLAIAGLLLVGAECYGAKTTTTNTSGTGNSVSISGMAFSPTNLTVAQGTTVTWTNNDNTAHTVTGDNGGPASGQLNNGQTYSFTFTTVGSFPYHCSNHPTMTGSVTVQ